MSELLLGKEVKYNISYDPAILFPISRSQNRNLLGKNLSFNGVDVWNCYEVSWLDKNEKPEVRILEIYIPANSPNTIESKSLKVYFNSINNHKFESAEKALGAINADIAKIVGSKITSIFRELEFFDKKEFKNFEASCIDNNSIERSALKPSAKILKIESQEYIEENLYSNLLKSNCLITSQPDWASVLISYKGAKIDHSSLLSYIISYRNHSEFHEHCVERIYEDIMQACSPNDLLVYARYTRRGGIDINPIRSSSEIQDIENLNFRLARQ